MPRSKKNNDPPKIVKKRAPARSLASRENQLISLAVDLAEKQLQEGTASAQVITHYLKLGTTRERLEKLKLEKENELLAAKTESLRSEKTLSDLYQGAIHAMRRYSGDNPQTDNDDE